MMNKTKIEWCDYTWNPVVGCKTGCKYCYAERMNRRFKWIPDFKEPKFYPERLHDPFGEPAAKIFVGSMCDLFGPWIPNVWIERTIYVAKQCDWHEFMFLTKYPERYNQFEFPGNCWLGSTVEIPDQKGMQRLMDISAIQSKAKKFLSIEPVLGSFELIDLIDFDLVIVGIMTGTGAIKSEKSWIESVKHDNLLIKNNAMKCLYDDN